MKLSKNAKLMGGLLALAASIGIFGAIAKALGIIASSAPIDIAVLIILLALLILHSVWQLGAGRATVLLLFGASMGLLFEVWGLKGGTFFGGYYVYNGNNFKLFGVPYIIPLYWSVFIYTAYSISNSFCAWLGRKKPSKNSSGLLSVAALVTADGLLTVALDLLLDPIKVREGTWTWLDDGAYFGIPIGNFIGWFIVTVLVTGIYRLYEYYRPGKIQSEEYFLLLPVIGYGLMGLGLSITAVVYEMFAVAIIGVVLTFIPVVVNLLLFMRQNRRRVIS